jgi:hypothetical protein
VAGNPGGGRPANPFGRAQRELRGALLAAVSPAEMQAVIRKVCQLAKRGSLPHVELLLRWTLGGPAPALDPDKLDEHEMSVLRGRPTLIDQLALGDLPPAGEDPAEAPATADQAADEDPLHPPLRTVLAWALEELSAAQTALRSERPDPQAGWEVFAGSRLEFAPEAAVDVDRLLLAYLRWCGSHGEPVLAEDQVLGWLKDHGAEVHTGPLSQVVTVVGVRVVA